MFDNFHGNDHLLVAMTDQPSAKRELIYIEPNQMFDFNDRKYGIFFTVQGFNKHRKKENLTKINAWAIDLDLGTKEDQKKRIQASPIAPSCIIESKNGYHVYWEAKDATEANFGRLMAGLVSFFNADKNAKDLCRILRVPCFYHWKDIEDPFLVKEVYRLKRVYSENEMLRAFAVEEKVKPLIKPLKKYDFNLDEVDCRKGLEILSGTTIVNGDVYTFKEHSTGTQIWVNDKTTACWIDKNGKIGSHDKGGPTLVQWLQWYHHFSYKEAVEILKGIGCA